MKPILRNYSPSENQIISIINHLKSVEKLFSKVIQSQKGQKRKYDAPFEMWELEKVLKSLKVKKSPGIDSLSNEIYLSNKVVSNVKILWSTPKGLEENNCENN